MARKKVREEEDERDRKLNHEGTKDTKVFTKAKGFGHGAMCRWD
jgi:hypothetical protein